MTLVYHKRLSLMYIMCMYINPCIYISFYTLKKEYSERPQYTVLKYLNCVLVLNY